MKSLNTTRGILFTLVKHCSTLKCTKTVKNNAELEKTRHRKKPVGGTRYLTNENNVYLFNAW